MWLFKILFVSQSEMLELRSYNYYGISSIVNWIEWVGFVSFKDYEAVFVDLGIEIDFLYCQ